MVVVTGAAAVELLLLVVVVVGALLLVGALFLDVAVLVPARLRSLCLVLRCLCRVVGWRFDARCFVWCATRLCAAACGA